MDIITRYKFIHFERISHYSLGWMVRNNRTREILGRISYYRPWKQYCFSPHQLGPGTELIFSAECLADIQDFLTKATTLDHD